MEWQLQEAKQRFSEVVRRAINEGPQHVSRHGKQVVVVVASTEFRRSRAKEQDFKELLESAPALEALELRRDKTPA